MITGAAGFIGSRLTKLMMEAGEDVVGMVYPGEPLDRLSDLLDGISLEECDLQDGRRTEDVLCSTSPEAVVHLAWYVKPGKYWTSEKNLDCLVQGLSLARAAVASGCQRFVGAGTCAEYDWAAGPRLVEGETPCRPQTLYGACKYALFVALGRYLKLTGVRLAWARYNFPYGPGEAAQRFIPSVIDKLSAGEDAPCTQGLQMRDFTYVDDVASATYAILRSDICGAINVASGEVIRIRDVANLLSTIIGGPGKPIFGALAAREGDPASLVPDVRRLREEVQWSPSTGIEEGLRLTVEAASGRG